MKTIHIAVGLILAVLFLAGCEERKPVTSPHWPLKQVFNEHAAVMGSDNESLAEVCIKNDCYRFVLLGKDTIETVHDFAFLYFWMVEGYDLAPRKGKDGTRFVETILKRQKGQCTGANEEAVARCTLAQMMKKYHFIGFITKPENGWNKRFPLDIAAEMRRANIEL